MADIQPDSGGFSTSNCERINRRYARHLKILGESRHVGSALRNDAAAKALLRWAATERETWLEAVMNPESFRGCCRAGFCRRIIWGNPETVRDGGGGWKCSGTPAGNCARSNPNSPVQTFVAYATKVRHGRGRERMGRNRVVAGGETRRIWR